MQTSPPREKSPSDKKQHRKAVLAKKSPSKSASGVPVDPVIEELSRFWAHPLDWLRAASVDAGMLAWEKRMVEGLAICERAARARTNGSNVIATRVELQKSLWQTDLGHLRTHLLDGQHWSVQEAVQWGVALCGASERLRRRAEETAGQPGAQALRRLSKALLSQDALVSLSLICNSSASRRVTSLGLIRDWSTQQMTQLRQAQRDLLTQALEQGVPGEHSSVMELGMATELFWGRHVAEKIQIQAQPSWSRTPGPAHEAHLLREVGQDGAQSFEHWASQCKAHFSIGRWSLLAREWMAAAAPRETTPEGPASTLAQREVWAMALKDVARAWKESVERADSHPRTDHEQRQQLWGAIATALMFMPGANRESQRLTMEHPNVASSIAREALVPWAFEREGRREVCTSTFNRVDALAQTVSWKKEQQQDSPLWALARDFLLCLRNDALQLQWAQTLARQGANFDKNRMRETLSRSSLPWEAPRGSRRSSQTIEWLEARKQRSSLQKTLAPPKDPAQKGVFFKNVPPAPTRTVSAGTGADQPGARVLNGNEAAPETALQEAFARPKSRRL